jgi:hypothetical protein
MKPLAKLRSASVAPISGVGNTYPQIAGFVGLSENRRKARAAALNLAYQPIIACGTASVQEGAAVERRAALPLQQHQSFATRNVEEARAFLGIRGFLLYIPPREAAELDMQLKSMFLPGLCFARLRYGAAAQVRTSRDYDDYRFMTPLRGSLCGTIVNEDVPCRPGAAMLVSPGLDNLVRVGRGTAGLNILLSGFVLRRHLAALLGEPLKAPLEFAAPLNLHEGHGPSLAHFRGLRSPKWSGLARSCWSRSPRGRSANW